LKFGFNFSHGIYSESEHAKAYWVSPSESRISFKLSHYNLSYGIFNSFHECGHYLYFRGVDKELIPTNLYYAASEDMNEAIAIIYQDFLGESTEFWEWGYPILQELFPHQYDKKNANLLYWRKGDLGHFLIYLVGHFYGAQLWAHILNTTPNITQYYREGNFTLLRQKLTDLIFKHGKLYEPLELIKKVTKEHLNPKYFINYLEDKYLK
jgi:Zn-dependent M32 family carboxypeptidase